MQFIGLTADEKLSLIDFDTSAGVLGLFSGPLNSLFYSDRNFSNSLKAHLKLLIECERH